MNPAVSLARGRRTLTLPYTSSHASSRSPPHCWKSHRAPASCISHSESALHALCLLPPWASRGLRIHSICSATCRHWGEHCHKRPFTRLCLHPSASPEGLLGLWSRGVWGVSISTPGRFFIRSVCGESARASLPGRGAVTAPIKYVGLIAHIDGGLPPFAQDVQNLILLLSENRQRYK